MSFGLVTYNADGSESFRGQYKTLRIVHFQRVAAGFTGNILVPGITPYNAVAYCVSTQDNFSSRDLLTSIGDGFVSLSRYHASYPPLEPMNLTVMRIR